MATRFGNVLCVIALAAFAALGAWSLAHYFIHTGDYRFGSEVAGVRYLSSMHYVGLGALDLGVSAAALIASAKQARAGRRLAVRTLAVAALTGLAFV